MPKYLCIQRSQPGGKRDKPSPAQMQEMYAIFNAWKDKFRENIVDMGGRLGGGKVVTSEGATDGPFVEARGCGWFHDHFGGKLGGSDAGRARMPRRRDAWLKC